MVIFICYDILSCTYAVMPYARVYCVVIVYDLACVHCFWYIVCWVPTFLGVSVIYEIPQCRFIFYFLCFLGRLLQRAQSIIIYVGHCLSEQRIQWVIEFCRESFFYWYRWWRTSILLKCINFIADRLHAIIDYWLLIIDYRL